MSQKFLLLLLIFCLTSTVGSNIFSNLTLDGDLIFDPLVTESVSTDFGGMTKSTSIVVFYPSAAADIVKIVSSIYNSPNQIPVSARGHGHSIHGQAGAVNGLVIDMNNKIARLRNPPTRIVSVGGGGEDYYVDVWGGELWIDVLRWTLENGGLSPRSWTDYLYLTVGGTLSNAGISGQAFQHGPQISNVYELDVVTGKGELLTCSEEQNPELFHSVLGGLGQFGIITRARIALESAPKRVRWIRMLYSNFTMFTRDQEYLISLHGDKRFDYVEGFVIVDEGLANNWRSSFFSPSNPVKISSIVSNGSLLYCLEVTKNYDDDISSNSVDEVVDGILKELNFIPTTVFTTDLPYVDFLDRVHKAELKLRSKGLWEVPHPWLNLFVPGSKIEEFDRGVFRGILGNKKTSGPILIYPMNRNRWDERSSAVLPEEENDDGVFYLVALLRSALNVGGEESQTLDYLTKQNDQILRFCHDSGVGCKQYLPHHGSHGQWKEHFGVERWEKFLTRKVEFDPKGILGNGQGIFGLNSVPLIFSS